DELDQPRHRPGQPEVAAAPCDGQEQAEHHGDGEAGQGDDQRVDRGAQQVRQDAPGELPVENAHDRPPCIRPRLRRRSSRRMARLIAWAMTKYSNRAMAKISRVMKVAWSSWRARNARSDRVISDTREVFLSSS